MIQSEVVLQGILKPDGTLELDAKPNLSPGRVTVVLRQESESAQPLESWWQFMQRARRELEESGATFMNEEQVNAHIAWLREGDPVDDRLRETDQLPEKPGKPEW